MAVQVKHDFLQQLTGVCAGFRLRDHPIVIGVYEGEDQRRDVHPRSEIHFQRDSIRRYRKTRRLKVFINAVGACRGAKRG